MVDVDLLGTTSLTLRDQCNLLQTISRKLKAKRSEAHPERLIGVASSSSKDGGVGNSSATTAADDSLIIHNVSHILPRLHQFAREQPHYFKFFYLSFLLDLLKADKQQTTLSISSGSLSLNDLFSYENDGNHQHWLCTHSCCMKFFDLIRFIVINQDRWIETAACLMLEARTCFQSIEIQQEEKLVIATMTTSKFVDDVMDMETITAYLIATLSVLNGMLKYIIALTEQQHNTPQATLLYQIVQSLGDSLLETIQKISTGLFINKLSGNDKELIETLLFITEIELRLKHIMHSYPMGIAFHTTCTTLYYHMQQVGMNAISSFVLFLKCISFDVNVLCDYLCSPETSSLQYLLRMTKLFNQYLTIPMDTPIESNGSISSRRKNIPLIRLCTKIHEIFLHKTYTLPPLPTLHTIPRDGDDQRVMIWIEKEHSKTVDVLPTTNDDKVSSDAVSSSTNTSTNTLPMHLPILNRPNIASIRESSKSKDRVNQTNDSKRTSYTDVINEGGNVPSATSNDVLVDELYDNIVTFFSGLQMRCISSNNRLLKKSKHSHHTSESSSKSGPLPELSCPSMPFNTTILLDRITAILLLIQ